MDTLTVERLAAALIEHTGALASAVSGLDPDAMVPTCPDWPVRTLTGHVGQAHRWATAIVRTREAHPVPNPLEARPGPLPGWLHEGVEDLVAAIRETGPDTPVWTFAGRGPARFWLRRMLHDTVIHHADAALAAGKPFTVAGDVATDGIGEWLGLLCLPVLVPFRPNLAELRGDGETLQLRPAEPGVPGWLITRTADGPVRRRATADADVVLTAPLCDLLLIACRRLDPPAAGITGESALLTHWLAHAAL